MTIYFFSSTGVRSAEQWRQGRLVVISVTQQQILIKKQMMINDGKRRKSRREKLIISEKGTSRSIGWALNFVQYQSYESK